jgi:hypothetical protein
MPASPGLSTVRWAAITAFRLVPHEKTTMSRLLPAALLITLAQPALADWQEELAAQLRWDEECEVAFYSGVIERMVNGRQVVIAKAHCEDGRVFDAIQRDEFQDFELNECTPDEQAC